MIEVFNRNGKKIERLQDLPKSILLGKDITRNKKHITINPQFRIPAEKIGLNFHHVLFIDQVLEILNKKKSDPIILFRNRNGERYDLKIKMVKNNKMVRNFVSISDLQNLFPLEQKYYGFLYSILSGTKKTWESLTTQINIFKQVFNIKTQAYKKVGRILSLTKSFWIITATFSMSYLLWMEVLYFL